MEKQKFNWAEFAKALRSLWARNPILIIIIYSLNQYGNNMKNGFRTLVGVKDVGLTPSLIGFALSVFMITGLLARAPSGAIADTMRSRLKALLAAAFVLKGVCWLGFTVVHTAPEYYALFCADAVIWSFTGTILPALLAVSIDRRAMGSGLALMMGICNIVVASARSVGISLYNEHGILAATLVAGATGLATAVVAMLLDTSKLKDDGAPQKGPAPQKKKGLFAGLSVQMLPFALVAAMPIVLFNAESNFFQVYAESSGFEYLSATTFGGTIYGILSIAVGFLCDIINPALLIVIALIGQAAAPLIWANATSSAMLGVGIVIYYSTRYFGTAFRVLGMKAVSRAEQGAMSATLLLCNDLFSVCCTSVLGVAITNVGYKSTFDGLFVWQILAVVLFVVLDKTFMKRMREARSAQSAAA